MPARPRPMLGQSHDGLETGMAGGAALVPRDPRGSLEDSITTAGKPSDKQSRDKRALPESALCSGPVTGSARDLEQESKLKYSAGGLGHPWVPIGTNRARICRSYRDRFCVTSPWWPSGGRKSRSGISAPIERNIEIAGSPCWQLEGELAVPQRRLRRR